jgi:hypothetical protein
VRSNELAKHALGKVYHIMSRRNKVERHRNPALHTSEQGTADPVSGTRHLAARGFTRPRLEAASPRIFCASDPRDARRGVPGGGDYLVCCLTRE